MRMTLSLKRAVWREADHPRGRDGRFIHAGDVVDLPGGGTGRVVGVVTGDRLAIQRADGGRELRAASEVSRTADAPLTGRAGHAKLSPPTLTDDERRALDSYIGLGGFTKVNTSLRTGTLQQSFGAVKVEDVIDRLDAVMARSRTTQPVVAWRGMSNFGAGTSFDPAQIKPGAVIVDKAFMSTSMDEGVARSFAEGAGGTGIRFKITVPAGTRALPVAGTSEREAEVILDRGSGLRIVRVTGEPGNYVVEAVVEQP